MATKTKDSQKLTSKQWLIVAGAVITIFALSKYYVVKAG